MCSEFVKSAWSVLIFRPNFRRFGPGRVSSLGGVPVVTLGRG